MKALRRKLVRDLWHLRGQVFATALVVACGVASFIAMRSTYSSLLHSRDRYYSEYRFADLFASLKRAPDSVRGELLEIPGVAAAETRVAATMTLDLPDLAEPAQGKVISIDPDVRTGMNLLYLLRGRMPDARSPDEIVISGAFAEANGLDPGDKVRAILNGRLRDLDVVGVALSPEYIYEIRPGDIFPDNRRFGILWMNRTAAAGAFQLVGAFNDVSIALAPGTSADAVIEEADRILEPYGGFGAYARTDQFSHRFVSNELAELEVFGTVIPAIFLAVTAFLLHLLLTRLVAVDREQIGLLKAFGYANSEIGLHYLMLSAAAVIGGIVAGIGLGAWMGSGMNELYGEFFHFPFVEFILPASVVLWSIIASFGAAAIGAAVAVKRAADLPPAEAMRPEPPADFQAGFVESSGLHRRLSPEWKIVVRNLARKPIKALLSAVGISLSIALLFIGFYFFDAINRIIAVQFENVQREDVEVVFTEPKSSRAALELLSMPGVRRVETFRSVPAILRSENHSRRVGIIGVANDAELRRIVNKDLDVVYLPPEGIVLGATIAKSLQIKNGDRVRIQVTEGARRVAETHVADVVEELLGLGAYMEIGALHRLMREEGAVSGAFLQVDEGRENELYTKLKNTPGVSGVGLPKTALASFNETIAQTIGTSTAFLIGFACVIAFGIVYNGARIALAERGRELASLRVLGFTRQEIGRILIGEQAVLTVLAVPIGYIVGIALAFLITRVIDAEIVRLPLVLSSRTFVFSAAIVILAAFVSALLVSRRLRRMDLISVLKTRE
ncbi:MAG TPA: FtsX-like permease family protein [Pyrinomonadaceae bacterium]